MQKTSCHYEDLFSESLTYCRSVYLLYRFLTEAETSHHHGSSANTFFHMLSAVTCLTCICFHYLLPCIGDQRSYPAVGYSCFIDCLTLQVVVSVQLIRKTLSPSVQSVTLDYSFVLHHLFIPSISRSLLSIHNWSYLRGLTFPP